ncbi:energy-coupling factor transporter ATPase [Geochorda subterranea]|uniref:Energy-coupling factor transporter ATPase n=1 Tax=Geochorda subterranea TaxID=3109564 RepID=A0ABZ1BN79_9FIRM|nr:energy-coupling factor transporter ATPase [Limnochorda sp. LNt]WRP14129.1 energy-coupling factor transporter ATPase [Limnochorda sp. LNt]
MPSDPLIEVDRVTYRYAAGGDAPAVVALNEVSWRLWPGELVAVVGRNGSGKSTLARHLNGLLLPDEGRVVVDGIDTRDTARSWEIRRRVGMIFQNPDNQLVATTVEEDVAFGPENLGIAPDEIGRRVAWALEAVGMTEYRRHPPHRLSGGQKQRVAIAGVLAMQPLCIVADEPTSMLDPRGRAEVMETLLDLRRRMGMAVVLITQQMAEAALADRVVVMDQGRVVLEGAPRTVFQRAAGLEALGLDLPVAVAVAERLRLAGVPVDPSVITVEELVEWLCPSSSAT